MGLARKTKVSWREDALSGCSVETCSHDRALWITLCIDRVQFEVGPVDKSVQNHLSNREIAANLFYFNGLSQKS
jgi:hypothetical protein